MRICRTLPFAAFPNHCGQSDSKKPQANQSCSAPESSLIAMWLVCGFIANSAGAIRYACERLSAMHTHAVELWYSLSLLSKTAFSAD
jgi:hypothetical protein